jgi:hypothetical protein
VTAINVFELVLAIVAFAASAAAGLSKAFGKPGAATVLLAVAGIACNSIWILRLVPAFKGS